MHESQVYMLVIILMLSVRDGNVTDLRTFV